MRATMARVYHALHVEGKVAADESKKLILEALMRPTTTGLIKGEQLPSSPIEAILNQVKGPE